uniref:G-protein coupled receptors family 1 profile domain-containing protein n=1 Tax=Wuchereria bancrofti TaxID=6293 RepID=A0AAF5Q2C4_WUCBA
MNGALCTVRIFSTFATIHFSFVLTLNRFVAIVLPKFNAFFDSAKLYFLFLFVWLTTLYEILETFTIKTGHKTNTLRAAKYERSILIQAMTSGGLIFRSLLIFFLPMILTCI